MTASGTLVLDNGASLLKAGLASHKDPLVMPNAIMKAKSERRRPFIGNQIDECRDASGLFYILGFQKGYLVNWDVQKTVWDHVFGKDCLGLNLSRLNVVVTEPFFNFRSVQEAMSEMMFEEYDVAGLLRANAGDLCVAAEPARPDNLCCLLVDAGYSFTHVVPYIQGKKRREAIRRIDVGGKVLTNHLKEIISYRQLHVMDETYVMNQLKEDCCFVSQDWRRDMKQAALPPADNPILRHYVLPDFTSLRRGYMKPRDSAAAPAAEGEQLIRLTNERFSVPELLFHPSDVGIQQMGIPEAIVEAVSACPPETWPHLYRNIRLVGGSSRFPGFRDRVYAEVRALAPDELPVKVTQPEDPVTCAWRAGAKLAGESRFSSRLVTRAQWEEHGFNICLDTFDV
ncbi:actin-related protein 6-like [Amphibalanus amphitrite]|uniref:actin-related protein 6-like n=1 Tax=Amphibalanus amphitrite TaxID=1232801 RepID=UPI001C928F61|nr:actin-related protein 6-like [Amphibalanus amphitrite]XP_043214149.1 actin-related protein 6-like [Amphibalanus amphitrite]XP_043214150.1 actin-related protein 6-like [Amphibalanus amphitrite]XP_043214151.1 actin-related protein 6-like [Amphibalanus amphitrite]XP_043214152.1 actin-related protein 6-like [Amphibalanus amphitrite]XP_043214153.1 actin-related protein 6-like [Amphibalanus amphitrite]XP_043214154.1 actin-related protein 6-like [Amphibalanus amphitrite]